MFLFCCIKSIVSFQNSSISDIGRHLSVSVSPVTLETSEIQPSISSPNVHVTCDRSAFYRVLIANRLHTFNRFSSRPSSLPLAYIPSFLLVTFYRELNPVFLSQFLFTDNESHVEFQRILGSNNFKFNRSMKTIPRSAVYEGKETPWTGHGCLDLVLLLQNSASQGLLDQFLFATLTFAELQCSSCCSGDTAVSYT
ncbi:hypothetical protein J6590_032628 [Homalodisca vitripennis]|nr:hypothetical protein J6590_032628 [Homalodisca vitripennis]